MSSWPGVFQFANFLVFLRVNRGVFLPSVLLRILLSLYPCCLSIWFFCYVPFLPIFLLKNCLFPCHLVIILSSGIPILLAGRIFSLFWNVLFFCIVLSCPGIFLGFPFLLSLACTFWVISKSCIVYFTLCVIFLSPPFSAFFLYLINFVVVDLIIFVCFCRSNDFPCRRPYPLSYSPNPSARAGYDTRSIF